MSGYVPAILRRLVHDRAHGLCEYCLIHESDTFFGCQIEHIVAEKHDGPTAAENLAYACVFCNRFKGTDLGFISQKTQQFCRFFNPRIDRWGDHFNLDGSVIRSLSEIGEVTLRIFEMNDPDRIVKRQALRAAGRYPPPPALVRMARLQP